MKTLSFGFLLLILAGRASGPSPRAQAASHARPVIAALRSYHYKFGDYPQTLNQLGPQYLAEKNLIYDNHDPRHSWFLDYQRVDRNHYMIYFDTTPCSQAVFKDGALIAADGPAFK